MTDLISQKEAEIQAAQIAIDDALITPLQDLVTKIPTSVATLKVLLEASQPKLRGQSQYAVLNAINAISRLEIESSQHLESLKGAKANRAN